MVIAIAVAIAAVIAMTSCLKRSLLGPKLKVPVLDDMTEAERQVLLCRGCSKVFVEPKTLACGHTLCASCISKKQMHGRVVCRVCNSEQEVARTKPDFRLQSCLDDVKAIKNALKAAGTCNLLSCSSLRISINILQLTT